MSIQNEREEMAGHLISQIQQSGKHALVFLKGGELGGLHPVVKPKLLGVLEEWFNVVEGEVHRPSFDEVAVRWGPSFGYQFEAMLKPPAFELDFLQEGRDLVAKRDEEGFYGWLDLASLVEPHNIGLLRNNFMMDYFGRGGQLLLLGLRNGVDRETIFSDLGLMDSSRLIQAVGEGKSGVNWTSFDEVPFQDFVKRIVVGNTTSLEAVSGSLRGVIGSELRYGALMGVMRRAKLLEDINPDVWKPADLTQDKDVFISSFVNGIHTPDLILEEMCLSSFEELDKFDKAIN